MSMQSGVGASSAAGEILTLIEALREQNKDKPDAIVVLDTIKLKAEQIKSAGDAGWY